MMNEGGLYEQGLSLRGNSMRGTWREGSFTGMGVCFHRGPAFREHGGTLFLRVFEIKRYIKRCVAHSTP